MPHPETTLVLVGEPSLAELVRDPVLRLAMASSATTESDLRRLARIVRAAGEAGPAAAWPVRR